VTESTSGKLARGIRLVLAGVALVVVVWAFGWVGTRPLRRTRLGPGQVQLTLLHWGDDREDKIVAALVAGFEKKYPDIRILRINPGPSDAVVTKFQTMVAAGDPPDVFQIGYERVAGWAAKGLLADLEPYLARDQAAHDPAALRLDDFYANVIDCFRFDGQVTGRGPLYAFAKDFTTVGFYYNRDLFRRAGLAEPPDDWTWDDFLAAARRIAELPGCYGADFVTWEAMLRVYCWTEGVDFTTDGFKTFDFTNPRLVELLDRLHGWFEEGRTLASAKTQIETGEDPFLTGRVGLAGPFGRWKVPVYRTVTDFDWDFAPLPHGRDHPPANGVFTSAWAMSSRTKHTAEAWKLVRYLCGEDGQREIAASGLAVPSMISVARSPAFANPELKPRRDDVYLRMVPYARAIDWPADQKYSDKLRRRMEEIFKIGQRPVAAVLADVQREWTEFRQATVLGGAYRPMPWRGVVWAIAIPLAGLVAIGAMLWWLRRPRPVALREELAGLGMVSPWVLGFVAFVAFPVVLSLLLSFTSWSGLATLDHADAVGLDNYRQLARDAGYTNALRVTVWYAVLAVPLGQIVALLAALLMNADVRGIHFFRAAWYLPSVLAGVAIAILWKWVFHHDHGMLNALLNPLLQPLGYHAPRWFERDANTWAVPAFVLMSFWGIGGTMMIYLAGLKGISRELYEAAGIDGATALSRFRHVTLPMLSPVIFFNTIMATIASFQVFTQAYVMTGGGPGDATRFYVVYLYNQAFDLHEMGYASAMAWLLLLIILALTLLIMRGSRRLVYYEALKA
jgi:multiple sugar transport system permease protein